MMLLVLLTEVLVGSATGVQRAVLSIEVSREVGAALALLPIISFGAAKSIADYLAAVTSLRKGRRLSLLVGVSTYLVGAIAITLLPSPYNFLLGNILVGAGEGFVYATAAIILRDLLGLERSALSFSYIESAGYIGYAVGAFLGGYTLSSLGPTAPLRLILAASALAFTASLAVPEVRGGNEYERPERWLSEDFSLAQLLKKPQLLLFSSSSSCRQGRRQHRLGRDTPHSRGKGLGGLLRRACAVVHPHNVVSHDAVLVLLLRQGW
uniref:MFS transporter n=1 Tax=Thermofilum pendens TaxID=2269 RepID=A0A7C3SM27_THEPE